MRESCRIYETELPDTWERFVFLSQLGASLLGQHKYPEAEPLLVAGHEGMAQREEKMPPSTKKFLTDALQRLVQLYDESGDEERAARWRNKLAQSKDTRARAK